MFRKDLKNQQQQRQLTEYEEQLEELQSIQNLAIGIDEFQSIQNNYRSNVTSQNHNYLCPKKPKRQKVNTMLKLKSESLQTPNNKQSSIYPETQNNIEQEFPHVETTPISPEEQNNNEQEFLQVEMMMQSQQIRRSNSMTISQKNDNQCTPLLLIKNMAAQSYGSQSSCSHSDTQKHNEQFIQYENSSQYLEQNSSQHSHDFEKSLKDEIQQLPTIQWVIKRDQYKMYDNKIDQSNQEEWNSIFKDIQNKASFLIPNVLKIKDPDNFSKMNDHQAREWLTQAIDQYRISQNVAASVKLIKKKLTERIVSNLTCSTSFQKVQVQKETSSSKIFRKSSSSYRRQRRDEESDGEIFNSKKGEYIVRQRIEQQNQNIAFSMTELNQELDTLQLTCCKCKNQNGQQLYQIIKVKNKHFIINKQFVHNINSKNGGSLILKISQYNSKQAEDGDLFKLTEKIKEQTIININEQVNISCMNPNVIQFIQNGVKLYYLKIKTNNNCQQIYQIMKYNLMTEKNKKIKQHVLTEQKDNPNNPLKPVSTMICQSNKLLQMRQYPDKKINEQDLISNLLIIIIYSQQNNNKLTLSIRKLNNFNKEIYKMQLPYDWQTYINQPHLLHKQYLKNIGEIQINNDLLVIGYKNNIDQEQQIQILNIDRKQKPIYRIQNNKQQSSLLEELIEPNKMFEYTVHDNKYPQNKQEILKETKQNIKQIAEMIIKQLQAYENIQMYYKCSADCEGVKYIEIQKNIHVHSNLIQIIVENLKHKHDILHSQLISNDHSIVFMDIFERKIIFLHHSILGQKVLVFEFEIWQNQKIISYEENLLHLHSLQSAQDSICQSPIIKLFNNVIFNNFDPIMMSYQFTNIIRDTNKIYCFIDNLNSPIEINDPYIEFRELTGCFNIISNEMKQVCQNQLLNLDQNTNVSTMTDTFLYSSNNIINQSVFQVKNQKLSPLVIKSTQQGKLLELSNLPFTISEDQTKEVNDEHGCCGHDHNDENKEYKYKIIAQSVIFKEDDRQERPLIIIQQKDSSIENIWFTIFDFKNNKQLKSSTINLHPLELKQIKNINDIKLTVSSSIEIADEVKNHYNQKYSLCIFFNCLMRFKIWEYDILWCKDIQQVSQGSYLGLQLIGMKEFIGKNTCQNKFTYNLVPKLTEQYLIEGIILLLIYDNGRKEIYGIDNVNCSDMLYRKRLTESRYQNYNKGFDNEFILVESKLSKHVINQEFFNQYELNQILRRQTKTILNNVPEDFVNWIERRPRNDILQAYDWFQSLELLKGFCILDYFVSEPVNVDIYLRRIQINKQLNLKLSQTPRFCRKKDKAFISHLEAITQHDPDECDRRKQKNILRVKILHAIGMIRFENQITNDLYQISIIERCTMSQDKREQLTADLLISAIYNREYSNYIEERLIMMKILGHIEDIQTNKNSYFNFINDPTMSSYFLKQGINYYEGLNLIQILSNSILPKYCYNKLEVQYMYLADVPKIVVDDLICHQLSQQKYNEQNIKPEFIKSRINHYIVDLRHHIFQKKMNLFRDKTNQELEKYDLGQLQYTECDLANDILNIMNISQTLIAKQQVIRHLIDYQFIITKKFFIYLLLINMFGMFVPFLTQIFINNIIIRYICILLMLLTTLLNIFIEYFQLVGDGPYSYFTDFWNINDLIRISLVWIYCFCRLNLFGINPEWEKSFILVKEIEFEESHIEQEIILNDLENFKNATYLQNNSLDTISQQNIEGDYNTSPQNIVYLVVFLHTLIIFQIFVKLLFFSRTFEDFSTQVLMLGQVIIDLVPFMIFFLGWIIFFSIIFRIIGMDIFEDDYVGFNLQIAYFIYTYRNSIGDVQAPGYNYWLNEAENNPNKAWMMISFIWTLWFLNQFINLIILLNFLISLIGESYGNIMSINIVTKYNQKAALNQECRILMSALGYLRPLDFIIVTHVIEENKIDENSLENITESLKQHISNESTKVTEKIEKNDKNLKRVSQRLQNYERQTNIKLNEIEESMKQQSSFIIDINDKLSQLIDQKNNQ